MWAPVVVVVVAGEFVVPVLEAPAALLPHPVIAAAAATGAASVSMVVNSVGLFIGWSCVHSKASVRHTTSRLRRRSPVGWRPGAPKPDGLKADANAR